MNTPWQPDRSWEGATVAVLGNGPNLEADLAKLPAGCKTIAAHRAAFVKPDADMMVTIDGNAAPEGFKGLYVVGNPAADGLYVGLTYERVQIAEGDILEMRNNALLAMRIAAGMGAAVVLLAGFDAAAYEKQHNFPGLAEGIEQVCAELRGAGIAVEYVTAA